MSLRPLSLKFAYRTWTKIDSDLQPLKGMENVFGVFPTIASRVSIIYAKEHLTVFSGPP